MTRSFNLFADLSQQMPDELFTTLLEADTIRIERIVSHATHRLMGSGTTKTSTSG
jgi:hypothetical protein